MKPNIFRPIPESCSGFAGMISRSRYRRWTPTQWQAASLKKGDQPANTEDRRHARQLSRDYGSRRGYRGTALLEGWATVLALSVSAHHSASKFHRSDCENLCIRGFRIPLWAVSQAAIFPQLSVWVLWALAEVPSFRTRLEERPVIGAAILRRECCYKRLALFRPRTFQALT